MSNFAPKNKEYKMKFKFINTASVSLLLVSLLISTAHAGLIHSYDFTGNAIDGTGSANGTVFGATLTTDRHGNSNSAYDFDGNDAIVANFTSPATATFSMWATWNGTQNDMLFNSGPNLQGVDLFFFKNIISWNTWDSASNLFVNISSTNIIDGGFHHYAVVNDAGNSITTLYIDGTKFGTAVYKYNGNGPFTIGAAHSNGSWGWSGKIDDVQVFDTALDAAGVQVLIAVPEPSTLAIFSLGMVGFASRRFKK